MGSVVGRIMGMDWGRVVLVRRVQEVVRAVVLLSWVVCRGEDILGAADEVRC